MRANVPLETILLFIGAILAIGLVTGLLTYQLNLSTNAAQNTASDVLKATTTHVSVVSSFVIGKSLYLLLRGDSGEINMSDTTLLINGLPQEFQFLPYKGDGDKILERGELFYVETDLSTVPKVINASLSFANMSIPLGSFSPQHIYFPYRRLITVHNSGYAITNYQLRIELNSDNFDLSKIAPDCSDLVVFEGSQRLYTWVEECSSSKVVFFVKIPEINASSDLNLYLYYGVTGLPLFQDPTKVFLFFDDFDTFGPWTCTGTGCDAVYTTTYDGKTVLHLGNSSTDTIYVYRPVSLSQEDNIILESEFMLVGTPYDLDFTWGLDDDTTTLQQVGDNPGDDAPGQYHRVIVGGAYGNQGSVYTANYWAIDEVIRTGDLVKSIYLGEEVNGTGTIGPLNFLLMSYDPDSTSRIIYIDWIRVRKYDPYISYAIGSEESGTFSP